MSSLNSPPVSAIDILGKLNTVGGIGSGIDADLLKGNQVKILVYNQVTNAILFSHGLYTVVDDGVGFFTVYFLEGFANTNYGVVGCVQNTGGSNILVGVQEHGAGRTTTSIQFNVQRGDGLDLDSSLVSLIFIGV